MSIKRFFDAEILRGLRYGAVVGAVALGGILLWTSRGAPPAPPVAQAETPSVRAPVVLPRQLDLGAESLGPEALRLARWIVESGDNGARPFVLLDKRQARVFVFEPQGRLLGASPVLLGYARGDHTVPGIGSRPIEEVKPAERTTPAGRFNAELGRNALGEEVVWIDYDAAVSMHRVRLTDPKERRAARLASPSPADNRISYGCVNLPVSFFEQVLWPTMRQQAGVVYVLPEQWPLERAFPGLAALAARRSGAG